MMAVWNEDKCLAVGPVRQLSELTEQNLVNWITGLKNQARYGTYVLAYGSPAGEMVARRIRDHDLSPLHSAFDLQYEPSELGPNEWQMASI